MQIDLGRMLNSAQAEDKSELSSSRGDCWTVQFWDNTTSIQTDRETKPQMCGKPLNCHQSKFSENFNLPLGTQTPTLWIAIDWNYQNILMCCWGLEPQPFGLPSIKILRKFWCATGEFKPSPLDCHWSKFWENFYVMLGTWTPALWIAIDQNSQKILIYCWGLEPQLFGLPLIEILR